MPTIENPATSDEAVPQERWPRTDRPSEPDTAPTWEWCGAERPPDAQGESARYRRPGGTRVCPQTLQYRAEGDGPVGEAFRRVYHPPAGGETRYYHSGVNRGVFFEWIDGERRRTETDIGAMVNAHSAAQPSVIEGMTRYPDVPVALDSGAVQGDIDPGEYHQILRRIDRALRQRGTCLLDRFDWVAQLDVIEGVGTGPNFFRTRGEGLEPLYVTHVTGPAGGIHIDVEPPAEQTFEIREGMMIGIGGLVPVIHEDLSLAREVMETIGEHLRRRGLVGHFFGVGAPELLGEFGDKGWFGSADSAKWLAGQKGRKLYRGDGSYVKADQIGLEMTREECARQNLRQIGGWMDAGEKTSGQQNLFSDERERVTAA